MRIAILGAGLSGLSTAWHLAKIGRYDITIFDPNGIGNGASGVAAGLLHPFAGARSRKNWRADEGMEATLSLIREIQDYATTPLVVKTGLHRPALTQEQKIDFAMCAKDNPDVNCCPGGVFIDKAYVVDCEKYLEALWLACANKEVKFEKEAVISLNEVDSYDHVVVAMGAASKNLPELSHLPITPIKGQVLTLERPDALPPLSSPISSQGYLLMHPRNDVFIAGATYERIFPDELPHIEVAKLDLIPKIQAFFPQLANAKVLRCRAGIRASTPDHRPLIKHLGNNRWVITGMGSKGLLYHALCSEELALQISKMHIQKL